jgi:hypothetical protein
VTRFQRTQNKVSESPSPESQQDYFLLRAPVIELFEHIERVRDGRIAVIEIKYGLPCKLIVEQPASEDLP